jgi:DNA-binding response OmpR family regulator
VRVLIVEDDRTIAHPLRSALSREWFDVDLATTGREALAAEPADIVLLDLALPDIDGRVVCREMRAQHDTPIIVVSARTEEAERVALLELGADDYLVKPFGFEELVARMRAVLRRAGREAARPATEIMVGPLHIDRRRRLVAFAGREVALTPKEFDLLVFLAVEPGTPKTRDQLMRAVWDEHWFGSTKTLDVHVASLRKKLDADLIETVRAIGYRLIDLGPAPA